MDPKAQQDINVSSKHDTNTIATKLVARINSHPRMRMISVGAIDSADKLDGTIYVDEKLYKVQIQILSGSDSASSNKRYSSVFTIVCGLDPAGGYAVSGGWQYLLPHPYNSREYIASVINNSTEQEQHVDIIKTPTFATLTVVNRPNVCHDVTFIGHVG